MAEEILSSHSKNDSQSANKDMNSVQRSLNAIKRKCAEFVNAPKTNNKPADSSADHCHESLTSSTAAPQASVDLPAAIEGTGPANQSSILPDIGGMHQFDREVEDSVMHRYKSIYPQLIRGLAKHLNNKVKHYAKTHRMLLLRPALLGPNEANACVWIVVNCEQCAVGEAKQFFHQAWVRSLYEASDTCPVGFKVFVDGPFRGLGREELAEVAIQNWNPEAPASFVRVTQQGRTRVATMGGVVLVCCNDGTESFYGLTVRHVLIPGEQERIEDSTSSLFSTSEPNDTNNIEPTMIGSIAPAELEQDNRNLDWTLIDLADDVCKQLLERHYSLTEQSIQVSFPKPGRYASLNSNPDIQGQFMRYPGHAILPFGHDFVEVYMLKPFHTYSIPGSSGSWVVSMDDSQSPTVYGILVAQDPQGMLWVVPMSEVLRELQEKLNAIRVKLPLLNLPQAKNRRIEDISRHGDESDNAGEPSKSAEKKPMEASAMIITAPQVTDLLMSVERPLIPSQIAQKEALASDTPTMGEPFSENPKVLAEVRNRCGRCHSHYHDEESCLLDETVERRGISTTEIQDTHTPVAKKARVGIPQMPLHVREVVGAPKVLFGFVVSVLVAL